MIVIEFEGDIIKKTVNTYCVNKRKEEKIVRCSFFLNTYKYIVKIETILKIKLNLPDYHYHRI
jgi:hypothetical protein